MALNFDSVSCEIPAAGKEMIFCTRLTSIVTFCVSFEAALAFDLLGGVASTFHVV